MKLQFLPYTTYPVGTSAAEGATPRNKKGRALLYVVYHVLRRWVIL
jgi:hypothetical protein